MCNNKSPQEVSHKILKETWQSGKKSAKGTPGWHLSTANDGTSKPHRWRCSRDLAQQSKRLSPWLLPVLFRLGNRGRISANWLIYMDRRSHPSHTLIPESLGLYRSDQSFEAFVDVAKEGNMSTVACNSQPLGCSILDQLKLIRGLQRQPYGEHIAVI